MKPWLLRHAAGQFSARRAGTRRQFALHAKPTPVSGLAARPAALSRRTLPPHGPAVAERAGIIAASPPARTTSPAAWIPSGNTPPDRQARSPRPHRPAKRRGLGSRLASRFLLNGR